MFDKGEKICTMKNNRNLQFALIASHFIKHIQLLRLSAFHTRQCFATCEIRLAWKPLIFDGSRTD
jgi:hypothetical protein